jgi:hypothetical protein
VSVTPRVWCRIRRHAPAQLRALARALLDCGVYDDTADMLASAVLMELNCSSWAQAKRISVRIKRDLDDASQHNGVIVQPAELPAELGTGGDARAMLRSQAARTLAEIENARLRKAKGRSRGGHHRAAAKQAAVAPTRGGVGADADADDGNSSDWTSTDDDDDDDVVVVVAAAPESSGVPGGGASGRITTSRSRAALGPRSSPAAASPEGSHTGTFVSMSPADLTRLSLAKAADLGSAPLVEGHAAWDFSTTSMTSNSGTGGGVQSASDRQERIRRRTDALGTNKWGTAIDDVEETVQAAAALAGLWVDRLRGAASMAGETLQRAGGSIQGSDPRWLLANLPGGAASRGVISVGGVYLQSKAAEGISATGPDEDDQDGSSAGGRKGKGGGGAGRAEDDEEDAAASASLEAIMPRMPTQRRERIWPPAVMQRLRSLQEVCQQLDRIAGPAHPACLQVQAAWAEASQMVPLFVRVEVIRAQAVRKALEDARAKLGRG